MFPGGSIFLYLTKVLTGHFSSRAEKAIAYTRLLHLQVSHIIRILLFVYVKTKVHISYAVTAQLTTTFFIYIDSTLMMALRADVY